MGVPNGNHTWGWTAGDCRAGNPVNPPCAAGPSNVNKRVNNRTRESDSASVSASSGNKGATPKKTVRFLIPGEEEEPKSNLSENSSDSDSDKDSLINENKENTDFLNTTDEENMSDSSDDGSLPDDGWLPDEDGMICLLHQKGGSWSEIAQIIRRGKRETKDRYRHLKRLCKGDDTTTDELADLYWKDLKQHDRLIPSKTKPKFTVKFPESESESEPENMGKGKGKAKAKAKAKKPKEFTVVYDSESSDSSSSPSSSSGSSDSSSDEDQIIDFVDVLCEQYPDRKKLYPDRFYSKRDVKAISALEARYRIDKWLYISAEFANITGRMVDPEMLKYKWETGGVDPKAKGKGKSKH
ncbi:hypothetical protein F5Y06DRAFT_185616 [Hypoxylon sp. FL0890]|nr:hypothetical protein F5Y06DRAFT_185616 [Hypoxylon sp. FL0890]